MGDTTSAHPCIQAFALPPVKDKQRSQPTPSDYTYSQCYTSYSKKLGYNLPTQTLTVALSL